jgi:hypothetical protein
MVAVCVCSCSGGDDRQSKTRYRHANEYATVVLVPGSQGWSSHTSRSSVQAEFVGGLGLWWARRVSDDGYWIDPGREAAGRGCSWCGDLRKITESEV